MFKMIKKFYEQSDVWIKLMLRGSNKNQPKTPEEERIINEYYARQEKNDQGQGD